MYKLFYQFSKICLFYKNKNVLFYDLKQTNQATPFHQQYIIYLVFSSISETSLLRFKKKS